MGSRIRESINGRDLAERERIGYTQFVLMETSRRAKELMEAAQAAAGLISRMEKPIVELKKIFNVSSNPDSCDMIARGYIGNLYRYAQAIQDSVGEIEDLWKR
jgi:hypothetical protein